MVTSQELPESRERAQKRTAEIATQMRGAVLADKLWYDHLSPSERELLGGSLEEAYSRFGLVGMWQKLRGCSRVFAVLDLARQFKLVGTEEFDRILDRLGEVPLDGDLRLELAVDAGHLVLRDDEERMLFWARESLNTPLLESETLRDFFVELAKRSKSGTSLDRLCYPTKADSYVRKTASRIRRDMGLPSVLTTWIVAGTRCDQKIDLLAETIRIFESDGRGELREWLP